MKRLIVCCDGTWNNPEQEDNGIAAPTNVVKIYNALAEQDANGIEQLKYYHPGVGGEDTGLLDSVLGGAFGIGIRRHLCSAYHWLGNNYEAGDEIYLFGFSRGAFTIRSLAGFLSNGLLNLKNTPSDESWLRVKTAFNKGYRVEGSSPEDWAKPDWVFFEPEKTPIHFVGVWDTVGSLGIPDDLEIINLFDDKAKWQFHNTSLGDNTLHARHAMAIDEVRSSFSITRWENAEQHGDAVEKWFPGVHCDVGGGYADCDLSNGALKWMMEQSKTFGLTFRPGIEAGIPVDPLGVLHNSYKGAFAKLRSRPRNIDVMVPANKRRFHESALKRQKVSPIEHPAYLPTNVLDVNESRTVDIFASERWNATTIYLEKGQKIVFSATGKWKDSKDSCDWKGTEGGKLTAGDMVRAFSSFIGKIENLFKMFSKNESTDFLWTKRVENMPWFVLVGAISNDGDSDTAVANDGSASPHQYVELPKHSEQSNALEVASPGYLYCFPNDAWSLYGNNRGSVQLTVTRIL